MKLTIDRKTLRETLEVVEPALGKGDSEPICSHYLLRVGSTTCEILGGGKGGLCGYARMDGLSSTGVDSGSSVEFTLDGYKLKGFLGDVPDCTLYFDYSADTKKVNVTTDVVPTKFNIVSLNPKDYPNFESDYTKAVAAGSKGVIPVAAILEGLSFTKEFTGSNTTNPGLSLVKQRSDNMVSGDGKAISLYMVKSLAGEYKLRDIHLSNVSGFISKSEGDITLYEGDNHYFFCNSKGHYFGFNKVDFDFPVPPIPDMASDMAGDNLVNVDKDALYGAIKRLSWALEKEAIRMEFKLNGSGVGAKMMVVAKDATGTISEEEVEIIREGSKKDAEFSFILNYTNVLKGLTHLKNSNVRICIQSTGTSFVKLIENTKLDASDPDSPTVTRILFLAIMPKRDR